jgi:hypothetical protein
MAFSAFCRWRRVSTGIGRAGDQHFDDWARGSISMGNRRRYPQSIVLEQLFAEQLVATAANENKLNDSLRSKAGHPDKGGKAHGPVDSPGNWDVDVSTCLFQLRIGYMEGSANIDSGSSQTSLNSSVRSKRSGIRSYLTAVRGSDSSTRIDRQANQMLNCLL